jgi:hypothetical protein
MAGCPRLPFPSGEQGLKPIHNWTPSNTARCPGFASVLWTLTWVEECPDSWKRRRPRGTIETYTRPASSVVIPGYRPEAGREPGAPAGEKAWMVDPKSGCP